MPRMFQIHEEHLAELERILPLFSEGHLAVHLNARDRKNLRRCKTIVSDIRWNYSPYDQVEQLPSDGEPAADYTS